jgi:hypothetical protein
MTATSTTPHLMEQLCISIISFMSRAGLENDEIQQCIVNGFARSGRKGNGRLNETSSLTIGSDTEAGAILRAWHRNPRYLDSRARPISLPMRGKKQCLLGLASSQTRKSNAQGIVNAMISAGLVRKVGSDLYEPVRGEATFSQMHPLAVDHVAKTVMRLVETVRENTDSHSGGLPLIERYAHVPDMDAATSRSFAEFSEQQGQAYLDAIEDWLEARRVNGRRSGRKARAVSAGVHLFAYLERSQGRVAIRPKRGRPRLTPEARV